MGSFEDHHQDAQFMATLVAPVSGYLVLEWSGSLPTAAVVGVAAFVLTILGGSAPDLDSHSSIPRQRARALGQTVLFGVPIALVLLERDAAFEVAQTLAGMAGINFQPELVPAGAIVLGLVGVVFGDNVVDAILPSKHRGIFHTPWFWAVIAVVIGVISYSYLLPQAGAALGPSIVLNRGLQDEAAVLLAGAFYTGVLTHLVRDYVL